MSEAGRPPSQGAMKVALVASERVTGSPQSVSPAEAPDNANVIRTLVPSACDAWIPRNNPCFLIGSERIIHQSCLPVWVVALTVFRDRGHAKYRDRRGHRGRRRAHTPGRARAPP